MRTSWLAFVLVACSGGGPAPVAKPAAPANKCAFVADHFISLLTKEAQEAPADEIDRLRAHFNRRCVDDGWSAEAQQCFLSLTAKEDINRCAEQLTETQRDAINAPPPESSKSGSAQ